MCALALTAHFNNTQTLKFKTKLTIVFFAADQWTVKKERNKMDRNLPNTTHGRDLLNQLK